MQASRTISTSLVIFDKQLIGNRGIAGSPSTQGGFFNDICIRSMLIEPAMAFDPNGYILPFLPVYSFLRNLFLFLNVLSNSFAKKFIDKSEKYI